MILIAAAWIALLLAGGGFALDRVLSTAITSNFDNGIEYMLTSLIVSAEIGPDGEVIFNRELADQRTLEPYSGLYWQVSARGHEDFPSRSLRSEEHTSELQSLMRISYAVFCLKKKTNIITNNPQRSIHQ